MEGRQQQMIERATAHFLAARRLMDKVREEPELVGLEACARVHIQRVRALSTAFCDGAELDAQACVAMSVPW